MEIISLKDLVPAATCSVNTKFIMLEKGKITHEKDKKCLALVADETASVHFQLWGTECEAFEPGDIIQLTKGIFSYYKKTTVLRAGKRGVVEKVGEFTMTFVETPNMSEFEWAPDPNNFKTLITKSVRSQYSQIFPPSL